MTHNFFIFRNYTVEPLFASLENVAFSGYGEIDFPEEINDYVWCYMMPFGINRDALADEINFFQQRMLHLSKKLPGTANFLCFTMWNVAPEGFSVNDPVRQAVNEYNEAIYQLAQNNRSVKVIDFATFASNFGHDELIDKRHFYLSQVPVSPKLASQFQTWFLQKIRAIHGIRKKCLVLDLDNTLWGGILGEEGISAIQLGNSYPGNGYRDFQSWMKEIKNTGVILALCSKNNPDDVRQLFDQREEMVLKMQDFSAIRINWKNKADNIMDMAVELNIGTDSMVFLDDSPFEREQVKTLLPEVIVPDFPKQPYLLAGFIREVYNQWFQVYELTEEDKSKTVQYQQNAQRKRLLNTHDSEESFLREMEIKLTISENNPLHIPRIAQMTQKTNQFNLTTKRYSETDILRMMESGYDVWDVSVSDKFGDSGITALAMVKLAGDIAEIDSFLLSCRILGRGIETAFLNIVLNRLIEKGIKKVKATFVPTAKNAQTENFFESTGFDLVDKGIGQEAGKAYQLHLTKNQDLSDLYQVVWQ